MWANKLGILFNQYDLYVLIHTAFREQHKFTAKYMAQGYQNIAELLELRKELTGVYRASWFLDPALKKISPRLAFLWEVPCSHGAKLYYLGLNDTNKAFFRAQKRKEAYERGEYNPRSYAYIWRRDDLMAWAKQFSEN